MKILGIDYGKRKIGLAISEAGLAEPLGIIRGKRQEQEIRRICQAQKIEKIVVGISEGKTAEKTQEFVANLRKTICLSVEFQDETLTSEDAIAKMREIGRKIKDEDAISAALILQAYLDRKENST